MNPLKSIRLIGLPFASLLSASVLAESPLISSHWEKHGWIITAKPEEAEIIVDVTYSVPEVIHDRDTLYFKPFWSEIRKYADGTIEEGRCITGCGIKTRCFGYTGISFDGMPEVQIRDEGIKVILDLSWSGRKTGHLKREFLVPWSELEKTVKDKEVEIHVSVGYPKKPTQEQIRESQNIPAPLPPTTPFESDPKAKAVYLENYQTAYRYFMAGLDYQRMDFPDKSLFKAYLQGQKDGTSQAVRDQMKDLIFHGSSKDYTKTIATPEARRVPWINSDTGLYIDASKAKLDIK